MNRILCRYTRIIKRFHPNRIYVVNVSTKGVDAGTKGIINESDIRPFSDIPQVKGFPLIGTITEWAFNMEKFHEFLDRRVIEYGPIYRERVGFRTNSEQIFTANVDDWENVLRGEARGNPAKRPELWSLNAYRNKRGFGKSFFNSQGEVYLKQKESVKSLLMPRYVAKLVPMLSDVTDDLTDLLSANIRKDGSCIIEDIRQYINKWTFECAGFIVFRTRFGLLSNNEGNPDENILKMLHASQTALRNFFLLETGLPHHKSLLTSTWRLYEHSLNELKDLGKQQLQKYGEYVTDKNVEVTDAERELMAMGVLIAAVDTTLHTALWVLIELSNNPEVQEKLYRDIIKNIPVDGQLTNADLQLPYLRGFLKEVFRVRPIIPISQKILTEDLVLSGYRVSTGSTVNLLLGAYNQGNWFTDANIIKPERWQRERKTDDNYSPTNHPFAVLPFGHGQRSCLGRRIAENELYIFIVKLVRRFQISPVKDYDARYCFFVTPEGEISFKLEERK